MAETVNQTLAEEAIRRHLELQHYSNAEVRKIIALLNRADTDLVAALQAALERGASDATVERIDALLTQVRQINLQAYAEVGKTLTANLAKFAAQEAGAQFSLLQFALPAPILGKIILHGVTGQQVRAAAMARPFQGRLLKEWLTDMEADRAKKIRDAVRIGFVEGEPTPKIVQRIRGTKAANYADGLLNRPRQELEAVVRTAISHTAAVAREATAEANADIVKATVWLATLDTKTCLLCATHENERYALGTHKPLGPKKLPWLGGPGRVHFNCRCTSTFVTKSFRELGIDLDELTPETRASMDGQVPAELDYPTWLAKQPMSRIIDVLGPARAKLFRDGKLKLTEFVNNRGKLLTLEQLAERDAAAFKKAGVGL